MNNGYRNIHKSAIVSENIRVRSKNFKVGKFSVIDDFTYISNKDFFVLNYSHIGPNCTFAGGSHNIYIKNHVSVSGNNSMYASSNNFQEDLVTLYAQYLDDKKIFGDIVIEDFCAVGSNSLILPNNYLPKGVAIGAMSLVPPNYKFEEFTFYSGSPIKPKKKRNRENIIVQSKIIEEHLNEIS